MVCRKVFYDMKKEKKRRTAHSGRTMVMIVMNIQTWQKWIYKSWHFSQAKCFLNIPFVVSFQKKKWTSLVIYSKLRISIMFIITVTWLIQVIMDIGQVFTRYVISSNTQTFFELFQKILIKLSLSEASY